MRTTRFVTRSVAVTAAFFSRGALTVGHGLALGRPWRSDPTSRFPRGRPELPLVSRGES